MSEPSVPDIWNNIAVDLGRRGFMAAACAAMRRAVDMAPERADLQSNYGNILRRAGRPREARDALAISRRLDKTFKPARFNKACDLMERGNAETAVRMLGALLKQDSTNEDWKFAHAAALLQAGRWKKGFAAYECRLSQRDFGNAPIPLWDGSPLEGRTLILHAEQGLGDTVMFHRFKKVLHERHPDAVVHYVTHAPLSHLLDAHRNGEAFGGLGDVHLPLMSLPHRLGVEAVSGEPYLRPRHRMALDRSPGARAAIGLVWKAKATWKSMTVDEALHGFQKSMPLEVLLELTRLPGVDLVSLQTGGTADIEALGAGQLVKDMAPNISDFSDLASFMDRCDAVVSVDTGPLHLAGALGRPTVACLHHAPSWQWGAGEGTPAWYDSVTCIRQKESGKWPIDEICARVEECLTNAS